MTESDKIDFSINYSDTSKRYLDGTAYDGVVRGSKKIIRYETYSGTVTNGTCSGSATCRLYFPKQARVRLTVKNIGADLNGWSYYPQALNKEGTSCSQWTYASLGSPFSAAYCKNIFSIMAGTGYYTAYSTDGGISWKRGNVVSPAAYSIGQMTSNDSYFVATGSNNFAYSSDGINWTTGLTGTGTSVVNYYCDVSWNGNQFFYTSHDSPYPTYVTTSLNGSGTWTKIGNSSDTYNSWYNHKYGGGYYVTHYSSNSYVHSSTDILHSSYNTYNLPLSRLGALNYGPGYWVILTQYGDIMKSTDASASSWSIVDGSASDTISSTLYKLSGKTDWCGICYGNYDGGRWVAYTRSGDVAVSSLSSGSSTTSGTLQFTNVSNSTTYTIKDEKTFTIEPAYITSTSGSEYYVQFNISNLQLVSAEITNYTYDGVTPINATYNNAEILVPGGSSESLSWGTRTSTTTTTATGTRNVYFYSGSSSDGNLSASGSGMTSYNSTYGWYPSSYNSWKTVTLYSDNNNSATLYVKKYTQSHSTPVYGTGSITFYSTGGVSQNLGTHTISSPTTYTFSGYSSVSSSSYTPGPNFGSNYGINKINYSISNASLTASMDGRSQLIRYSYGNRDPSIALRKSGELKSSGTYVSEYDDDWSFICLGIKDGEFWWNISSTSSYNSWTGSPTIYIYYSYTTTNSGDVTYDAYSNCLSCSSCSTLSSYYKEIASGVSDSHTCDGANYYGAGYPIIIIMRTPPSYFYVNRFYVRNWYGVPWGGMNCSETSVRNNEYITANGSYIQFCGDATVHVTVTPSVSYYNTTYDPCYIQINGSQSTVSSNGTYTIPSSAWSWNGSQYTTTLQFYNTSAYYVSQNYSYTTTTTIYPTCLLANSSYNVSYSYNNASGTRYVTTGTTSSYDSSLGKYYIQLGVGYTGKFAMRKISTTETVDDMIDFNAGTTSSKNGYLSASFSGTYSNNMYYITSSSTTLTLTASKRGWLELTVAPYFYYDSGTIKMNYGSNTSTQTITGMTTIRVNMGDMQKSGSSYYMTFTCGYLTLINAKFHSDPSVIYTSLSNTSRLDWRQNSPSASYVNYSSQPANYSLEWGYQRLNSSYPLITWNSSYPSDITGIIDARSSFFAYWYMPEYNYGDSTTNFIGPIRLFSPIKRSSSRKYMQMYPYSSTYNNLANIMEHDFTLPYNRVLYGNGYQTSANSAAGVAAVTAAACAKLKSDWGTNLRIYVVKYREQSTYKSFPIYNASQTNITYDYSAIENCATNTGGTVYSASGESDLKARLDEIAASIKTWAGYEAAKIEN
ncbi:MAG: hypothetical protein IJ730_06870 [Alphaproteobacteria bacterium]|nr:hypothetical protein [Alphaproteobacteria bacterium]